MRKVNIDVEGEDGGIVSLTIIRPDQAYMRRAFRAARKSCREALLEGRPTDAQREELARKQGDAWQERHDSLMQSLTSDITHLNREDLPLSERLTVAIRLRRSRKHLKEMIEERVLESPTAEEAAQQAAFELLVVRCATYRDTRRHVFQNLQDYKRRSTEPFAVRVAAAVAKVVYGFGEYPEEQFLREHHAA
jgi:hypothetical protein